MAAQSFNGRRNEVVFAVATKRGAVMPDLRGQSVRDVARMCAQLGLRLEARGEGWQRNRIRRPALRLIPARRCGLSSTGGTDVEGRYARLLACWAPEPSTSTPEACVTET